MAYIYETKAEEKSYMLHDLHRLSKSETKTGLNFNVIDSQSSKKFVNTFSLDKTGLFPYAKENNMYIAIIKYRLNTKANH